jgi:hypothetical protein
MMHADRDIKLDLDIDTETVDVYRNPDMATLAWPLVDDI